MKLTLAFKQPVKLRNKWTFFQIRGAQILDSVRLYKQGFPTFMPLGEFRRKFGILAGDNKITSPVLDEKRAVEDMLLAMDLELSSYRVGLSQVSLIFSYLYAAL